nr:MAG TPA: hypothetical protein [Caudoviricetes sp.]
MANIELPKDAEGREIPLDTKVLYGDNGEQIDVSRYQYYPAVGPGYWKIRSVRNMFYRTDEVHLTPPDTWERLLEDLDRGANALPPSGVCAYLNKDGGVCADCLTNDSTSCDQAVLRDIADRIRKLRGEDE